MSRFRSASAFPTSPISPPPGWRTVSDQKNRVYYFESTLYPNIFWVDMKDVDFSEGAPVRMLDLVGGRTYAGNTASLFVEAEPFEFERVD